MRSGDRHWGGHHGRTGGPHRSTPGAWSALHGLHRRLVGVVLVALFVGGGAGYGLHLALAHGPGSVACVLFAVFAMAWPLGWMATLRIVRPLRDLARVAGDLRGGHLERRMMLPEAGATAKDEVGEVAGALRGMADRVAQQLADQRALMATVSHELRSPLARVRVLVEMLREGSAPTTAHDDVQGEIDGMDALAVDTTPAPGTDAGKSDPPCGLPALLVPEK